MKKENIIICITASIILISIISIIIVKNFNKENTNQNDSLKFKEEYESLNNTKMGSSDNTYSQLTIAEDNPMIYIDAKKAQDVLSSDKAIIYVGAAWCPWCRKAVPIMLDVAKKLKIDTIYYLNLDNEKSKFEIKDNELITTQKGTDDYYKLLDALEEYLEDYKLTDNSTGKEYDTKEKRIYMPYIITIKDGKIVDAKTTTIKTDDVEEEKQELNKMYSEMLSKIYPPSNVCTSEDHCN